MTHDHDLNDRDLSELAALADGSLPAERAEQLEQRIASSPQLGAALEVQRRAVRAVRSLDDPAPERLRARVEREVARGASAARRRRLRFSAAVAVTCACAALALVLLPAGAGDPTVVEAAALAQRPARLAAPVPARPALLDRRAEGLAFPDWEARFRWRATGARLDELEGRRATTVFYENPRGARIGYTILSGPAIDPPLDALTAVREGIELRSVERAGRRIVTWRRAGRTCVLSGAGVKPDVLLELAAWRAKGAIAA